MSKRLAEGNRVRTRILTGQELVATGVPEETLMDTYMFQDDVTVIGVELKLVSFILDAQLNADAVIRASAEITRRAGMHQDGALLTTGFVSGWTAAIVTGRPHSEAVVMFPIGQGVEIDEGESLNLILRGDWIGTGNITLEPVAIVYYVER